MFKKVAFVALVAVRAVPAGKADWTSRHGGL